MVLLKFLLFAFVAFYIFSKISGFLLRSFIKSKMSAYQQHNYQEQKQSNREGVRVDYVPKDYKNSKSNDRGDYVDYEEVDES